MREPYDPTRDTTMADLCGAALVGDAENAALDDPRYLDWIAAELTHVAARSDRRVPDARYLARGRALRDAVQARGLGIVRHDVAPTWRRPAVRGTPATVLPNALAHGATPLVDLAVAAGSGRDLWDEPCERWIALPAGLPPARYLALRIHGDSMVPLLHGGDAVLVKLDATPHVDGVVIARVPNAGYVCKRVRRVTARTIELDSLAPDGPSFVIKRDPRLVLGTVVAAWPV